MNLTEHEQKLLLRALDKASAPAEAEKAAEALINSLRERGISGYDLLKQFQKAPAAQQAASGPVKQGWGDGPGYWSKNPDGSTCWVQEDGKVYPNPPNPRMTPEREAAFQRSQEEAARRYYERQKQQPAQDESSKSKFPWRRLILFYLIVLAGTHNALGAFFVVIICLLVGWVVVSLVQSFVNTMTYF